MGIEEIPEDNYLYRRVRPKDVDPTGSYPTEIAFMPGPKDNGELSVDWAEKSTPEKSSYDIISKRQFRLAKIRVSEPITIGLKVKYDPILKFTAIVPVLNPAHTLILGIGTLTIANMLSKKAPLIV